MLACITMFFVSLMCVTLSHGGLTPELVSSVPRYNMSVSHGQNQKGRTFAQVHLEHEDGKLWDFYVSHTETDTLAKVTALGETMCIPKMCHPPPSLGYEYIGGLGYYKLYDKKAKTTWSEAKQICEKDGGHLLIINTEPEFRAALLMTALASSMDWFHWIGFHDQYKEGNYVTIFNETLQSTGFAKIFPGELNGGTSENCGGLCYKVHSREYGLIDDKCSNEQPFICEFEIS